MSPTQDGGTEWGMYQLYDRADTPDAKQLLRCQDKAMDDMMVRLRGGSMKPCYGTTACKRVVTEELNKPAQTWQSEALGAVHFAEYD